MSISPEIVGVIGVAVLLIALFAGVWIGFAMGLVGFLGFVYLGGIGPALKLLGVLPYAVMADYTMSTLPLFVFMGVVAAETRIADDLYAAAHAWIGHVPGGLAMATCIGCTGFAAVSGTSIAGSVTMGKVAVPEMKRRHYDESLATSCVAAGGTLGILIPPSLGFILYAILTEQSVGKLFLAGILPGMLLTALFVLIIGVLSWCNPRIAPAGPKTSFRLKIASLRYTWAILALFLLVMGGIYTGIFTPTEAGAIGAFGAILISAVGRRLTRQRLRDSLLGSAEIIGMIVILIVGAFIFMRFLAISKLPFALSEIIAGAPLPPYAVLVAILFLYIIMGMLMDIWACIILTVPIIFPVIVAMGFDPIWYGVIMVITMEMGMITPPVGLNVFVVSGVTGTPVGTVFRGTWLFTGAMLVCIIIVTIFPQIALFIPNIAVAR